MHVNMRKQRSAVILILCNLCHIVFLNPKDAPPTGKETVSSGNGKNYPRTTNQSLAELCVQLNTCDYSKNVQVPNCYCDEHCHIYDDCCIDHHITTQMDVKELDKDRERENCHQLFGRDLGAFVVSDCPHSPQSNDITSGVWRDVPVTGYSSTVYKNIGIASCNNEKEYFVWTIVFLLRYCNELIEIGSLMNMSDNDRANYYHGQDCEHYVIPPIGKDPRFCIPFVHNESECIGDRIPVESSMGPYRNNECCKQLGERCKNYCVGAGISPLEAIQFRTGKSMTAIFQFSPDDRIKKENRHMDIQEPSPSSNVRIRNAVFSKTCIASVEGEIDLPMWRRTYIFYKLSLQNALKHYDAVVEYFHSFMFLKSTDSNKGKVFGYTNVKLNKDLVSFNSYQQIEAWLYEFHVTYTDAIGHEATVFNISLQMIDNKEKHICIGGNPNCKVLPLYDVEYDQSDALSKIKTSDQYLQGKCNHVQGIFKKKDKVYNLNVQCLATERPQAGASCVESNLSSPQHLIMMVACLGSSSTRNAKGP